MNKLERKKVALPISSVYRALETNSLKDVFIESAKLIRAEIVETTNDQLIESLNHIIEGTPAHEILSSIQDASPPLENWLKQHTTKWAPTLGEQNIQTAAQAKFGITYCDQALAESGTVVLLNEKDKGRSVSLLPEIHIVLIPVETIVPRLQESMRQLHERITDGRGVPSCINFITGPSNSADIESYLVVGVHGPLQTIYVIIDGRLRMLGAIEAGGTKMNCAIGDAHGNIMKQVQFPTTTPVQNMRQFIEFFQTNRVDAIGVGAFGPVNVDRNSTQYGTILDTPKLAWRFFPFLQTLKQHLDMPIELQSDVNVAALGEAVHGAGKNDRTVLYITIGTGIGGGVVTNKQFLLTAQHPEMGHVWIKRAPEDTTESNCPFHTDCFEGLASGPAIEKRWHTNAKNLRADHPAWDLEANYIAQGVYPMVLAHAPDRIIIGGGVMNQPQLLPKVKQIIKERLNGYTYYGALANLETTIVLPKLGDNAGLVGGLVFAGQIKAD